MTSLPPVSDLVAYSAVTMLFMSPIASLLNTILVNRTARKIGNESKEAATAVATHAGKVASDTLLAAEKLATHTAEVREVSKKVSDKIDEIHVMVNDNLTKAIKESEDLRLEVAELTERLSVLTPEHFLAALDVMMKKQKSKRKP